MNTTENKYSVYRQRMIQTLSNIKEEVKGKPNRRQLFNELLDRAYIQCPWCDKEVRYRYKFHFRQHYTTR